MISISVTTPGRRAPLAWTVHLLGVLVFSFYGVLWSCDFCLGALALVFSVQYHLLSGLLDIAFRIGASLGIGL